MMRITIDGVEIHYDMQGEGPKVLLLHGWGGSAASFAPVAAQLAAQGFCAVSIDFPGFGQSGKTPPSWDIWAYARITRGFMRELQLEGCDVIAHSFGGRVTLCLAAQEASLFRRIVLTGCAGIRPKRSLRSRVKTAAFKAGKRLRNIGWINRALKLEQRIQNAGSPDYRALDDDMKKVFVRIVNEDLTPCLSNILRPTLLIWGKNDMETPLYMADIMHERIRDSGLVVLDNGGHFAYLDEFARFMVIVLHFLRGE